MKTNQFELSGFVGNAPDLRFTPNGTSVATLSVYTKERWSGSDGAAHEKTQRHQITAWAAQAEFAQQRLIKGTRVQIIGRIDQQSWGEGAERQYKTVLVAAEIVLVSFAAPEQAPSDVAPATESTTNLSHGLEYCQTKPPDILIIEHTASKAGLATAAIYQQLRNTLTTAELPILVIRCEWQVARQEYTTQADPRLSFLPIVFTVDEFLAAIQDLVSPE